jgi:hypothetical protein
LALVGKSLAFPLAKFLAQQIGYFTSHWLAVCIDGQCLPLLGSSLFPVPRFTNPYIVYYLIVSHDGTPFTVNRTVRDIQEEVNKGGNLSLVGLDHIHLYCSLKILPTNIRRQKFHKSAGQKETATLQKWIGYYNYGQTTD